MDTFHYIVHLVCFCSIIEAICCYKNDLQQRSHILTAIQTHAAVIRSMKYRVKKRNSIHWASSEQPKGD
ncbi:Isopentenyl-diphosphate delta isomerase [Carabus blaptoides fortunei]